MSQKKPKNLIERNGKQYKLNNEALKKRIEGEVIERELDSIISTKKIPATKDAIKKWMKPGNGTDNIEAIEGIAEYYGTNAEEFLIQTDEVWEHIEKAKSIDSKRTLQASVHNIRKNIIDSASDEPGYEKRPGLKGIIDQFPKGFGIIMLVNFFGIWSCTLDIKTLGIMGPVAIPLLLEYFSFMAGTYFDNESKLRKIGHYMKRIIEFFCLIAMAADICKFYHLFGL